MNGILKLFFLCPVPEDQKPMNEYISLKENEWQKWIPFWKKRIKPMIFFLISSFFFLLFSTLNPGKNIENLEIWLDWILLTSSIFLNCFLIFTIGVFFRWNQLQKQLNKSRFFYEEGSWYDGQFWEKPISILKNDRFISTQQVAPMIESLKKSIFIVFGWNVAFLLNN